jgi:DNA-binding PadR family transcriptional regulator
LLHQGKSHGYELARELSPFGLGELDPSLVYRMLRAMETAGLVVSEWDADVEAGMPRRVYHLTAEGDEHLSRWVRDLGATDEFLHHFLDAYKQHAKEDEGEHS